MRRGVTLLVLFSVMSAVPNGAPVTPPLDLIGILQSYADGRHREAVATVAADDDLGPFRLRFVQDVPLWVAADPAQTERRRAVAAAFLVELARARLESDYNRLSDVIEFMCGQMRLAGPPTAFERAWYVATVALASRARARLWLLGESPRLPHQPPLKRAPNAKETPSPKHLIHAIERNPDDLRLKLAQIVAWTWGRDNEPIRNTRARAERSPWARSGPPQLDAITALRALLDDPVVGPEATVRIGLVHFSVGDYAAAVSAFLQAEARSADPRMKYLALLSAGRAYETLNRTEEAMAAYARALAAIPGAESATVALASLQFARDEREAAMALLAQPFSTTVRKDDPGRLMGYGSFLYLDDLIAEMRKELSR